MIVLNEVKLQFIKNCSFLIINKSDFLPESVREKWAEYFKSKNINFVFFSALAEQ